MYHDIEVVANPTYQSKKDIYERYKGYCIILTNIKMTPVGEPFTWVGGIVRFYSKSRGKLYDFLETEDRPEYENSTVMHIPDYDKRVGSLGGIWV